MEVDSEKTVFFDFQKTSKIKGFRLRMRETANRILRSLRVWEDRGKQCFTRSVKAPESPENKRIFAR